MIYYNNSFINENNLLLHPYKNPTRKLWYQDKEKKFPKRVITTTHTCKYLYPWGFHLALVS